MLIVGAGPAGCLCAKEAAKRGAKVEVWEEHDSVGEPVQCAGLVSKKGLDALEVDYKSAVLNECRGARFYSPSGYELEVKRNTAQALVVNRAALDSGIAEEAESEGAEIVSKTWKGEKADILVGADGAHSSVVKSLGLHRDYIHAYQVTAKLEKETDFVELHFGDFAPGFFAWIIPIDDSHCRVGIGVSHGNPKMGLAKFLNEKGTTLEYEDELSSLIPVYSGAKTVFGNIALVGDAAAQVKASTGGGVAIGGQCARMLGKIVGNGGSLSSYESEWRKEFGKELETHSKIHDLYSKVSSDDLDDLFDIAQQHGLEKLAEEFGDMERPSKLISAIMHRPALLMRMSKYAKYL